MSYDLQVCCTITRSDSHETWQNGLARKVDERCDTHNLDASHAVAY